jgi:hypothetical protein
MINPIKRIWVPKKTPVQEQPVEPAPAATQKGTPELRPKGNRPAVFDELPSPDMEEKNSDSIWAAFDSVHVPGIERK